MLLLLEELPEAEPELVELELLLVLELPEVEPLELPEPPVESSAGALVELFD